MTREIKFRAWNEKTNKMEIWEFPNDFATLDFMKLLEEKDPRISGIFHLCSVLLL